MKIILDGIRGENIRRALLRVQGAVDAFQIPDQDDFELWAWANDVAQSD